MLIPNLQSTFICRYDYKTTNALLVQALASSEIAFLKHITSQKIRFVIKPESVFLRRFIATNAVIQLLPQKDGTEVEILFRLHSIPLVILAVFISIATLFEGASIVLLLLSQLLTPFLLLLPLVLGMIAFIIGFLGLRLAAIQALQIVWGAVGNEDSPIPTLVTTRDNKTRDGTVS